LRALIGFVAPDGAAGKCADDAVMANEVSSRSTN
jgi:hypothetical protein